MFIVCYQTPQITFPLVNYTGMIYVMSINNSYDCSCKKNVPMGTLRIQTQYSFYHVYYFCSFIRRERVHENCTLCWQTSAAVLCTFKLFPVQQKNSFSFFFKTHFKREFHYFSQLNYVPTANPLQLLNFDINIILKLLVSPSLQPVHQAGLISNKEACLTFFPIVLIKSENPWK